MSEALSEVYTITGPSLLGVWAFDPLDPTGTLRNFPHADGRTETRVARSARLAFAGRSRPVVEYGEQGGGDLTLSVLVPFGPDHDAGVQWWRDAVDARRTINYRDGRGRLVWASLADGVPISDERGGTRLDVTLVEVDYDETVA